MPPHRGLGEVDRGAAQGLCYVSILQGGLPIIVDGDLIGAIGVSGVKSFQDEQIAMTAIKAVFPDAKTVRAGEENDARDF